MKNIYKNEILLRSYSMQLFFGLLLLMVYVVTLSYKGSVLSILTVPFVPKPMDTIEEIANQVIFKKCLGVVSYLR